MNEPWNLRLVEPSFHPEPGSKYTVNHIVDDAMVILRSLEPDELNWVFLSTSGVHGSYCTLDEIESDLALFASDDPLKNAEYREKWLEDSAPFPTEFDQEVTVLIVMPRCVTTMYGNAVIRRAEDIALLRRRVEQTIAAISASQDGNREESP